MKNTLKKIKGKEIMWAVSYTHLDVYKRQVDVALVEGVPEEDILKIKQEKITDKTMHSIRTHGWLPDMFRQIIRGAKDFLQEVIFKFKLPPKPVPKIDLQEWKDRQKVMYELQRQSRCV